MGMGNERSSFEQKCFRAAVCRPPHGQRHGKSYAMLADRCPIESIAGLVDRRPAGRTLQFLGRLMGLAGGVLIGCGLVKNGIPAILMGVCSEFSECIPQ